MENTIENKARFFAQYFRVENSIQRKGFIPRGNFNPNTVDEFDYLELKPLNQITDEDLEELANIINYKNWYSFEIYRPEFSVEILFSDKDGDTYSGQVVIDLNNNNINWSYDFVYEFGDYELRILRGYQYLQSKGYAIPYMGISVEELINWGWVTLKLSLPQPPLSRFIREGVSVFCHNCGSTISKRGFLMLYGKRYCDNPECKNSKIK